ncbi:O-methyltransferase [Haliovirga abyssi]|uniref:tRNA 5-hydroxyuridine methyltransferase n=1 Tax=Haliovirga abyssi TaxID=2996794 RepID=A0AAU9DK00_9FUSO|nr:O-methyltransferase [Haliovirga abyssi]BDU50202.1 caffeoyl-CoA O-methyltransferase [Haliovirga abyssi]
MIEELNELNSYIIDKIEENDELLLELEKYAVENRVPIVTKEVAKYLEFMAEILKSKNILEIGSAIGYSGIILAKVAKKYNGKLTTIEIDEDRYNIAKINFEKAKLTNVNIILGDALDVISGLDEKYDFIFLDAAKGKYMDFFKKSYEKLNAGGVVFIDNILFRGYVNKIDYPKRYKTIVKRLNEFIDYLYKNHDFVLLPFGDGIGLVKK